MFRKVLLIVFRKYNIIKRCTYVGFMFPLTWKLLYCLGISMSDLDNWH